MSVEEEDGWREQSDVEVVDVNLNLVRINVHQSYCTELRDISRRFLELQKNYEIRVFGWRKRERRRRRRYQRTMSSRRRQFSSERRPNRRTRTLSMVLLMIRSISSFFVSVGSRIDSIFSSLSMIPGLSLQSPQQICINPKPNGNDSNFFLSFFFLCGFDSVEVQTGR